MLKNNKGITLSALIITVIVLVTIAGTAVYTGIDVYQDAKQEALVQELQIIQNAVNNENSKIELATLNDANDDGAFDYIYNLTWESGKELPNNLSEEVKEIIGEGNGYRYFESEDLKEIGIIGANIPVLINYTTRDVILEKGFNGKYRLSEFNETTNYNSNVVLKIDNVPIPNGFVYLTGTKEDGLVIKNIQDGNEFVWVPVDNTENFTTLTNGYSYGSLQNILGREPDVLTGKTTTENGKEISDLTGTEFDANEINRTAILEEKYENTIEGLKQQFKDEYNAMVTSVKKHEGFYVGRYETSWIQTKVASIKTVREGQIMTGNTNLSSVGWEVIDSSLNSTTTAKWYGLYAKQKELYKKNSNSSVVSGMIYGCQWDAIMNWMRDIPNIKDTTKSYIEDATDMGWYSENYNLGNPLHLTGLDLDGGQNKVKNIYDLFGNYNEWTQEAHGYQSRFVRGGSYADDASRFTPSTRHAYPCNLNSVNTSRLQLYIK